MEIEGVSCNPQNNRDINFPSYNEMKLPCILGIGNEGWEDEQAGIFCEMDRHIMKQVKMFYLRFVHMTLQKHLRFRLVLFLFATYILT